MKIAVFGYHDIGYECLKVLIEEGEKIIAVVTHKDDPDEEIWFRSVAELARTHRLPLHTPLNPNTPEFTRTVRELCPDIFFSFYYRRLLSNELLAIPRLGGINLHGSLLPKYRGRSPVNWVLVNGESRTGVTLHYMVEKADAGDIISQRAVPIDAEDTALSLFRKLTAAAAQLLRETLPLLRSGAAPRIPQNHGSATIFGRRRPEDGKINWSASAFAVHNLIRAVTHPYPGAFTFYGGRKLYLWSASIESQFSIADGEPAGTVASVAMGKGIVIATGSGGLLVRRLQFEGGEEMAADEFLERHRISVGARLGQ